MHFCSVLLAFINYLVFASFVLQTRHLGCFYRSYYFDDDDKDNLNDWSASLTRDRYHSVCEERNAYQQMQQEMTGAIDEETKRYKTAVADRDQLEKQFLQSEQYSTSAKNVLQSVLIELGVRLKLFVYIYFCLCTLWLILIELLR
jgi:hypothetical protein